MKLRSSAIGDLAMLRTCAKSRRKAGLAIVVGQKAVDELLERSPRSVEAVYTLHRSTAHERRRRYFFTSSASAWRRITNTQSATNAGASIAASMRLPPEANLDAFQSCSSILVVDRIQDPGNMGTLARTAAALGFDGFYAVGTPSCCPYNDKALNASKSAMWSFDAVRAHGGTWEEIEAIAEGTVSLAAVCEGTRSARRVLSAKDPDRDRVVLALGSEAAGLPAAARRIFAYDCAIDLVGDADSLNVGVAGGILMNEVRSWREKHN